MPNVPQWYYHCMGIIENQNALDFNLNFHVHAHTKKKQTNLDA